MKIFQQLKQNGYRFTKPRQEIIKFLVRYPLTVQEIFETLQKKKIAIDLASVYRTLELFVKMGIVNELELGDGKKRYELRDEDNHHHHLICNSCKKIEDIFLNEEMLMKNIRNKSDYKIASHKLEFFGLCASCQ